MADALNLALLRKQLPNRHVPSSVIYGHRSIASFAQIMFPSIPGQLWELLAEPKPVHKETKTTNTAALAGSTVPGWELKPRKGINA